MIEFIITLLYLHIVTLEIKVTNVNSQAFQECLEFTSSKGWLAIAKLKPLSLFISLLSMPKKAFDNVKIEK